jgi:glycosyltransferase involved in cell wall biosynthesis
MDKDLFLGTDLHGSKTELCSKLVNDLLEEFHTSKALSIQNIKGYVSEKRKIILPRIFKNNLLRKSSQGILIFVYVFLLRFSYNRIFTFWSVGRFHYILFKFMKFLRYKIIFTVITDYEKDYSSLKFCDVIICQSDKMGRFIQKKFPDRNVKIIYPWTNLDLFVPKKKSVKLIVPSIPYKTEGFQNRGIDKIISLIKKEKLKSTIIFRSKESYEYVKALNLKNCKLIYKVLNDADLSKEISPCEIMPLIYVKNIPDMPLSAIEGLAAGCKIICTSRMGLSDIIKKEKCGIIISEKDELMFAIKITNKISSENCRNVAKKYFDKKINIKKYKEIR